MTQSSSVSGARHILATRYAASLIEAAIQSGAIDSIEKDMVSLWKALSESAELNALIGNPVYSKDQQLNVVQGIAQKASFHKVTSNFLGVLAMKGRLSMLSAILAAFFAEMEKRHNVMEAKVVSAFPLSEAQQKALADTLSQKTGKAIRLDLQIDKSLLGGMVVTVGSRMIDDSLKTRLSQLKVAMTDTKAA